MTHYTRDLTVWASRPKLGHDEAPAGLVPILSAFGSVRMVCSW